MAADRDTPPRYQRQQPLREHLPRALLVIGGVLAIISTTLSWLSVPALGGLSLWQIQSIGSSISDLADGSDGAKLVVTGILLWGIAVLVLGSGAVLAATLVRRGGGVRVVAAVYGGACLGIGLLAVVLVAVGTEAGVGIGAGEILLLLAGGVVLAAVLVPVPESAVTPDGATAPRIGAGDVLARGVALVGVACLVAAAVVVVAGAVQPRPEPHAAQDTSRWSELDRDADPPSAREPDGPESDEWGADDGREAPPETAPDSSPAPTPESRADPADPDAADDDREQEPVEVVTDFYDAINTADYQLAWELGGKNLNDSYADFVDGYAPTVFVTWTTSDVTGDEVSGSLDTVETDGTGKEFAGTYTVRDGEIVAADIHQTY